MSKFFDVKIILFALLFLSGGVHSQSLSEIIGVLNDGQCFREITQEEANLVYRVMSTKPTPGAQYEGYVNYFGLINKYSLPAHRLESFPSANNEENDELKSIVHDLLATNDRCDQCIITLDADADFYRNNIKLGLSKDEALEKAEDELDRVINNAINEIKNLLRSGDISLDRLNNQFGKVVFEELRVCAMSYFASGSTNDN